MEQRAVRWVRWWIRLMILGFLVNNGDLGLVILWVGNLVGLVACVLVCWAEDPEWRAIRAGLQRGMV